MSTQGRAQFTPGPWVVNTFIVNGQHKLEVLDATGANACVQANAHLIAAAPVMYEELGKCVSLIRALQERLNAHEEMCNFDDEEIAGAIAALAQAEGRQG